MCIIIKCLSLYIWSSPNQIRSWYLIQTLNINILTIQLIINWIPYCIYPISVNFLNKAFILLPWVLCYILLSHFPCHFFFFKGLLSSIIWDYNMLWNITTYVHNSVYFNLLYTNDPWFFSLVNFVQTILLFTCSHDTLFYLMQYYHVWK